MPERRRIAETKTVSELEQRIVKVPYSDTASPKAHKKESIDTANLLRLAKKIRKTYDYNDIALGRTH